MIKVFNKVFMFWKIFFVFVYVFFINILGKNYKLTKKYYFFKMNSLSSLLTDNKYNDIDQEQCALDNKTINKNTSFIIIFFNRILLSQYMYIACFGFRRMRYS